MQGEKLFPSDEVPEDTLTCSRETPSAEFGNEVPALVERSRAALGAATECYGADVMTDMHLGFPRPFAVEDEVVDLPLVADVAGSVVQGEVHDTLSLVISYRHTTRKEGFILNVKRDV